MARIITVKDPKTGHEETREWPDGFKAMVVCDDGYYLDGTVGYRNGTIIATIKKIPDGE